MAKLILELFKGRLKVLFNQMNPTEEKTVVMELLLQKLGHFVQSSLHQSNTNTEPFSMG